MSDYRITAEEVEDLVERSKLEFADLGLKTTVLVATLPNGFEVCVSSSCVDPANYDPELGRTFCRTKLVDKVWELEGYLLQSQLDDLGEVECPF